MRNPRTSSVAKSVVMRASSHADSLRTEIRHLERRIRELEDEVETLRKKDKVCVIH